ncbi:MAG: hypothetical protein M1816_006398 [Peltula sp. TS41687]|nr:MAG: hypothetical protein M1816_006398 [Peltula sp. TS41687]
MVNISCPTRKGWKWLGLIHRLPPQRGYQSFGGSLRGLLYVDNPSFRASEEIRAAVAFEKPVVALETTIYTHGGFPYPENLAFATHLELLVRQHGGIPAHIGIFEGVARVGMTSGEMAGFLWMTEQNNDTLKVSQRDLAYICGVDHCGRKLNGGTTIAATMQLAKLARIKVLATGGLGGVHRGGELSLDVSADLRQMAKLPVAVISSGCKGFLDIPRTLAYLETEGVAVATFADGRDGDVDFPAFWTRESGVKSPYIIQNEIDAASMIYTQRQLSMASSLLFANPIPSTAALDKATIDQAIQQATDEAEYAGIHGKENTPFILKRIHELTGGASTAANKSLVESNVIRGTKVAVELAKLLQRRGHLPERFTSGRSSLASDELSQISRYKDGLSNTRSNPVRTASDQAAFTFDPMSFKPPKSTAPPNTRADIFVAGALAIDYSCDFTPLKDGMMNATISPELHTSNPATITASLGGVGHNVAYAAHLLGSSVRLCSVVASDFPGSMVLRMLHKEGLRSDDIKIADPNSGLRTGQYIAFNNGNKDLVMAMADVSVLDNPNPTQYDHWQLEMDKMQPKWLVVDGNWDTGTLRQWTYWGKHAGAKIIFEPVSTAKAARFPFSPDFVKSPNQGIFPQHLIDIATPNEHELNAMFNAALEHYQFKRAGWSKMVESFQMTTPSFNDQLNRLTSQSVAAAAIARKSIRLLPYTPCVITKLGREGVLLTELLHRDDPRLATSASDPYILCRTPENEYEVAGGVYVRHFPPPKIVTGEDVVSVNGAGDTFLGVLVAGLARPKAPSLKRLIEIAQRGSVMTLQSRLAVHPSLGELSSQFQEDEDPVLRLDTLRRLAANLNKEDVK